MSASLQLHALERLAPVAALVLTTTACVDSAPIGRKQAELFYGAPSWSSELARASSEVALIVKGQRPARLSETHLLCPDEILAHERSLAFCSGVLVAPDVVLTAGHCLDHHACDTWFATTAFDDPRSTDLPEAATAECSDVLAGSDDIALVRLKSALPGAPARLRTNPLIDTEPAYFVSHPLGISTRLDVDAAVRPHSGAGARFRVAADAFAGSSGGGVFDQDDALIAILTSGLPDFEYDSAAACLRIRTYDGPPAELAGSPVPILESRCRLTPDEPYCVALPNGGSEPAPDAAAPHPNPGVQEQCPFDSGHTQGEPSSVADGAPQEPADSGEAPKRDVPRPTAPDPHAASGCQVERKSPSAMGLCLVVLAGALLGWRDRLRRARDEHEQA